MADRFEDLRTFTTIIAAGGINAAAAELGIAKSAVSRRLSDLEKRLGVSLVERSGHRLGATALGAAYARRAHGILASLDELDASLTSDGDQPRVSIGASAALIRHVLTPAIAASPLVGSGMLIRMSEISGNDFDVLIGAPNLRLGAGRALFSTSLVMCASPGHLERHGHPDDHHGLDLHGAIAIGDAPHEWQVRGRRRPAAKVSIVTSDADAAAAAAIAGLGLAQIPDYVVAEQLSDGRLVQVLAEEAPPPSRVDAYVSASAGIDAGRLVDMLAKAIASNPVGSHPRSHEGGDGV